MTSWIHSHIHWQVIFISKILITHFLLQRLYEIKCEFPNALYLTFYIKFILPCLYFGYKNLHINFFENKNMRYFSIQHKIYFSHKRKVLRFTFYIICLDYDEYVIFVEYHLMTHFDKSTNNIVIFIRKKNSAYKECRYYRWRLEKNFFSSTFQANNNNNKKNNNGNNDTQCW